MQRNFRLVSEKQCGKGALVPMHMYGKYENPRRRHTTPVQRIVELFAIVLLLLYLVFIVYQVLA